MAEAERSDVSQSGSEANEREARFNRRYRLLEIKERREDRALRRLEIENSAGRGIRFTTSQATVAAAFLALFSAVLGGAIQGWFAKDVETERSSALLEIEKLKAQGTIDLEKEKQVATERLERLEFETTLILKAIEAPLREDQIRNLKFFLNAGFISDADGKIARMDEADFPSLPSQDAQQALTPSEIIRRFRGSVGRIVASGVNENGEVAESTGTFFIVDPQGYALTAAHLFPDAAPLETMEIRGHIADPAAAAITITLIEVDRNSGAALIKLASVGEPFQAVSISPLIPELGQALVAFSFPMESYLGARLATVTTTDGGRGTWSMNMPVFRGEGGSPVFSNNGTVVGMILGKSSRSEEVIVLPMNSLRRLLLTAGVEL